MTLFLHFRIDCLHFKALNRYKSYIEEGEAGIVCLANPKSFAVAIERVSSMPKLAIGMGENGRDIAEKYFTWSRAAEQLDQEYRKMVC